MRRPLTALLASAALAGSLLLTACSSDTSTTEAPPVEASSAPATSAPASSAPASPSAQESSTSTGSQDGDKPTKDEIVAGLAKFYQSSQGLNQDKAEKFAVCMVDEMYDKAATATLVAMRDGDPTKADPGDASLIAQSGVTCAPTIA